ncbi:MAG: hypothetical protein KGL35_08315, partial [Bradyrhizobium sp.]|nr:hypothetical protein [Bradyrhizobium sp.]
MKPIAIIGDSWATGPAPFQPNLGEAFSKLGIPNEMFQVFMTGDVLKDLDGIIASGQGKEIGSHYSMVLLSLGSHDIAAGTPDATIIKNLVGIGNDCAKMGLKCEIIAFPKITTNGVDAWFPTPEK